MADHFRAAEVLDCANDERAVELAKPLLARGDAVEIWERARFVTRVAGLALPRWRGRWADPRPADGGGAKRLFPRNPPQKP